MSSGLGRLRMIGAELRKDDNGSCMKVQVAQSLLEMPQMQGLSKILHNAKPRRNITTRQPNCFPRKMSTQITPLQPSMTNVEWDSADQLGGEIQPDTQRSSSWDVGAAWAPADLVNGSKNPSLELEENLGGQRSEELPRREPSKSAEQGTEAAEHEDGQPADSGEGFQSLSPSRFIRDEYLERIQFFCDQAQDRHVTCRGYLSMSRGWLSLFAGFVCGPIRLFEQLQRIANKNAEPHDLEIITCLDTRSQSRKAMLDAIDFCSD